MDNVKTAISIVFLLVAMSMTAGDSYKVYVDRDGVMRRDDTRQEVSYYGVNYTAPFAHAYRALSELDVDHKKAIDRDVYHMARLGFNAYRIHIWDVEISDSVGNVIDNDHLDLLDYLISKLEERNIKIILTAQTNFGNGYPERNTDPNGAFTYDYEKCRVHDDEAAIRAQERYIKQLVEHRNEYTGKTYAEDLDIIAMEINNEPCHSGTAKDVTRYINRMVKSLKKGKWQKPILYNVSHNMNATQGFYDADIDGTTYQWYPVNLVAGHTRKGNFLPYVDEYYIPFADKVKGFDRLARVVYEFDPADNLYSYLYPAIARTFRKGGFQWITQFAYDPIDMAWANSEYQTHFLNLAYTPRKALSMMIAAEVAREVERGADYGKYPVDTIFGDFMVSARQDLSMLNDGKKYLYTNNTSVRPKSPMTLRQIAGYGTSAVVKYSGTGAYFLDRLADGVWRLEVMPDVVMTSDPFAKPSLSKRVGEILYCENPMTINLPDIGGEYHYQAVDAGNHRSGKAERGAIKAYPGVYILSADRANLSEWSGEKYYDDNKQIGEYVAPAKRKVEPMLLHEARQTIERGESLTIRATIVADEMPDSVVVYPDNVSFWNDHNRLYKMTHVGGRDYEVTIDAKELGRRKKIGYNIVIFNRKAQFSYPQVVAGTPLDWDYLGDGAGMATSATYRTEIVDPGAPIILFEAKRDLDGVEMSTIPASWRGVHMSYDHRKPMAADVIRLSLSKAEESRDVVMYKYVADLLDCRRAKARCLHLAVDDFAGVDSLEVALINRDGFTYSTKLPLKKGEITVDPMALKLSTTLLSPEPYPSFMKRTFEPDEATATPLRVDDVEKVQIVVHQPAQTEGYIELRGAWLE